MFSNKFWEWKRRIQCDGIGIVMQFTLNIFINGKYLKNVIFLENSSEICLLFLLKKKEIEKRIDFHFFLLQY